MQKIATFLKETRRELRHVNWPTRKETTLYTILVAVTSIAIAYYLGLFDLIFTAILEMVI